MTVKEFLLKYRQSAELIDGEMYLAEFLDEMKKGLNGKSSLAMIPTYLYESRPSAESAGKRAIVIDAGGTNFRSAVGYFTPEGKAVFEKEQKTYMPATNGRLSKEEFYGSIAQNIKRLVAKGGDIGFCFSYPVEMQSSGDGNITSFTKAVDAPEAVGTPVGKCTLEAVKKFDGKDRKIVILNDTVAALLGGLASVKKEYSAYVGYIFGTGTNICYSELTENVLKAEGLPAGKKLLINTECGNFNKFPQGIVDKEVADGTEDGSRQLFEKMTSGKYLATLVYKTFLNAVKDGVLSSAPESEFELKDVSEFLAGEKGMLYGSFENEADRRNAEEICRAYVDRSAKLGAIANAAAVLASSRTGGKPVAIFAEGTTFEKLHGYRQAFEKYLSGMLAPRGIGFEIIRCKESNLKGCLTAILTL